MHDVVVYSREGCHLCEAVKETLMQVQGEADFQWRELDIAANPQLPQEYTDEVPVVFIDGRKAFKYRMDGRSSEPVVRPKTSVPSSYLGRYSVAVPVPVASSAL